MTWYLHIEGILPKGPYPPCVSMADRALFAGYPRIMSSEHWQTYMNHCFGLIKTNIWLTQAFCGCVLWVFIYSLIYFIIFRKLCDINSTVAGRKMTDTLRSLLYHITYYGTYLAGWCHTWRGFPHYWPFVRGIPCLLVVYPHKQPVIQSFDVFFDVSLNTLLIN